MPAGGHDDRDETSAGSQRLDKWLWFARVTKSRTLASALVADGRVRVNRARIDKPSHALKVADVVTLSVHRNVRVLEVVSLGERRGPASEAAQLYRDLTPAPSGPTSGASAGETAQGSATHGERDAGSGRPTKRERREIDRLRGRGG